MNRENYLHEYQVESSGYVQRGHPAYKPPNPNEGVMGMVPTPSIYPYQGPATEFPIYQPTVPPTYEPHNYEQKFMNGYDDQSSFWRGYENQTPQIPPPPPPPQPQPQVYHQPNIIEKISFMI